MPEVSLGPARGVKQRVTSPCLIGADTGGTDTDAATIEAHGHRVVASARAINTRGDLAIGVSEAITQAVAQLPQRQQAKYIRLVAMPAQRVRQLSCTVIQWPDS